MRTFTLIALVAFLGYAVVDCRCLECSKRLTVIEEIIPVGDCPPRHKQPPLVEETLKIQVQIAVATPTKVAVRDYLRTRVFEPLCEPIKVIEPCRRHFRQEVKVPFAVPTRVTHTTINVKPTVEKIERIVHVPKVERRLERRVCHEPVILEDSFREVPFVRETPFAFETLRGGHLNERRLIDEGFFGGHLREHGLRDGHLGKPILKKHCVEELIAPGPVVEELRPRYGNSVCQFSKSIKQVDGVKVEKGTHLAAHNRSKREVPFLRHGYKFVMNMLPEFIQEPIKHTVNNLALAHPDQRLQRLYNQPRELTLKESLKTQRKKHITLLRNTLRNGIAKNSLIKKPFSDAISIDKEAASFVESLYGPPNYSKRFYIRPNFADRNDGFGPLGNNEYIETDSDRISNLVSVENVPRDTLGNSNAISRSQKVAQWKKASLLRKLQNLNENQSRKRRSAIYEKHWSKRFKKPSSLKKRLSLFDTSEIVLPFYEVKGHGSEEIGSYNYEDNPWVNPPFITSRQKYRRDDDNFLRPYSFKDVATDNHDFKEHFLRNVIRDELGKYRVQTEEPENYLEPLSAENKLSHSPLLHVITFPLRLLSNFNEITKQAFPIVGSFPKMITGTKRYFKDFGRNLKKNILHLTSDLIGDFENLDLTNSVFGPLRQRRSTEHSDIVVESTEKNSDTLGLMDSVEDQNDPNYFFVLDGTNPEPVESKVRTKRYMLKRVDEDEIEEYLVDKLGSIFDNLDSTTTTESYPNGRFPHYDAKPNSEEESEDKLILEHLKPKIILDNNGKPFLEINGYRRPLFRTTPLLRKPPLKKTHRRKSGKLTIGSVLRNLRHHDSSEEADSDKIASLIHHAKSHMEDNLGSRFSEMPVKTIKERISQLLFETDILVHMDFEKYDDVYDDLVALQQMKNSISEDWKRLIMSKVIDDIGAKTLLLERFKELQYYKDATLENVVATLYDDSENVFIAKKLIKMLVRLQKLQCLINQVVSNFHGHLHISSKSDIEKEIRYADFLSGLSFANEKSRNDMISNLTKDRDAALQRNIFLLDKLKKLLKYENTSGKVEKEASLLWEMRNIEKMQKTSIEELKQRLDYGYKIKNELKILFDLLRRYEACEADQKKLLSKFQRGNRGEEENSGEKVESKNKKAVPGKRIDLEELKLKWQKRLKRRNMLLKEKLERNKRRSGKKSKESDDD